MGAQQEWGHLGDQEVNRSGVHDMKPQGLNKIFLKIKS